MSPRAFVFLLLATGCGDCADSGAPRVGVTHAGDFGDSRSENSGRECAKYSHDSAACTAAGCDLQAHAIRLCINDEDRCVIDEDFSICAFADGRMGSDGITTGYFAEADGRVIVVETSIHHGFASQSEWRACNEELGGPSAAGAPEECRCVNAQKPIEGHCP